MSSFCAPVFEKGSFIETFWFWWFFSAVASDFWLLRTTFAINNFPNLRLLCSCKELEPATWMLMTRMNIWISLQFLKSRNWRRIGWLFQTQSPAHSVCFKEPKSTVMSSKIIHERNLWSSFKLNRVLNCFISLAVTLYSYCTCKRRRKFNRDTHKNVKMS